MSRISHATRFKQFMNAVNKSKSFHYNHNYISNGTYETVLNYYTKNTELFIVVTLKNGVNNSFYLTVLDGPKKLWNNVPITIKWYNVRDLKSFIDARLKDYKSPNKYDPTDIKGIIPNKRR